MRTSTGVYPLEEGDVSMIARAWLTEAAEHSIDVQYFIFSADNVGLIAVDYMLRAADRGVRVRLIVDDFMLEADADKLLALDAHPNIEIRLYNPTTNIARIFRPSSSTLRRISRLQPADAQQDLHRRWCGRHHRRSQYRRRVFRLRSRVQLSRSRRSADRRCIE
jgi:phosphatidylserine/phosphatidylglycerophosphate/cardiolipin synthase-like enzyme